MQAMILENSRQPLRLAELPVPEPGPEDVVLAVHACGVCRTDLHILDGELPDPKRPLVPGHQIVGTVTARGGRVEHLSLGERVGVPWLGWTCGQCRYCRTGRENLCDRAQFTGYHRDGGFAEFALAHHRYCFPLPADYPDEQAAPLLCGGLIGYRALRMIGAARRIGFYGFGSAAHILIQVARYQGREVAVFTRPDDVEGQEFAQRLGATWVGDSTQRPPAPLDAAIIFAPVGDLAPAALQAVGKGGVVVCAGIHMSAIPSFPYAWLWEERVLRSVANLTRQDGAEFLTLAPCIPIRTQVQCYPLARANEALADLRAGRVRGTAVIQLAGNRRGNPITSN